MDTLPFEILSHISDFLPPKELIHFYSASPILSSYIHLAATRIQVEEKTCANLIVANYSTSIQTAVFLRISINRDRVSTWLLRGRGSFISLIGHIAASPFVNSIIQHFLTIHFYKCHISSQFISEIENVFGRLASLQLFFIQKCTADPSFVLLELSHQMNSFAFSTQFCLNEWINFGPLVKIRPDVDNAFMNPSCLYYRKALIVNYLFRDVQNQHLEESNLSDLSARLTSTLMEGISLEEYDCLHMASKPIASHADLSRAAAAR